MLTLVFVRQDVKKAMQRRNIHTQRTQHLGPDKAAQTKDGDVVDPEPVSEATRAGSIQRPGNASRKRMMRSRCNPQPSMPPLPLTELSTSSECLTEWPMFSSSRTCGFDETGAAEG